MSKSTVRERQKARERNPQYYIALNEKLAVEGRTAPLRASTTKGSIDSLLRKWTRFCNETRLDSDVQRSPPRAHHFKTFLKWILDRYPRVRAASSLQTYWLNLNMYILGVTGHGVDPITRRDVVNYKRQLTKNYRLRKLARAKPVMSVDDLYHILFTHWVYDDAAYVDERQRVQVAAALLLAAYTGCRPCSLFDTNPKKLDHAVTSAQSPRDPGASNDTDLDSDSDSDDTMSESSSESGHDNGCDPGSAETASIRYSDVRLFAFRPRVPGGPNLVAAKVTLLHTKGAERKTQSSVKTFVFEGESNPLFCLLDHLLSMAFQDNAFAVSHITANVANIFRCQIPDHKTSVALNWKDGVMDLPIFRQPVRSAGFCGTSDTEPLRSGTWRRYLKRLGLNAGLEHPFTQYSIRRGLLNKVNGKAPDSVRNQIFDHASTAPTPWYLDQEVRFDTQAVFLERPSDGVVQKLARLMTMTADRTAPTKYSDKALGKVANDRDVRRLSEQTKRLTGELKKRYGYVVDAPETDPIMREKETIDAALHTLKENLRNKLLARDRRRHFRDADTSMLEAQFSQGSKPVSDDTSLARPTKYNIPERGRVVELLCNEIANLTDEIRLARRISTITEMTTLCGRRETARRRRPTPAPNCIGLSSLPDALPEPPEQIFRLECLPTQCPVCIGDKSKSYEERTFPWSRRNKMWDHFATDHLNTRPLNAPIRCHHPICMANDLILETLRDFRNHTERIHKIRLREDQEP